MLIVMDRRDNYCLFFGGIANTDAIFVWFLWQPATYIVACCNFVRQQGCASELRDKIAGVTSH